MLKLRKCLLIQNKLNIFTMCKNGKLISVKIKGEDLRRVIQTNCGNCLQCRTTKSLEWTFRCYTEYLRSDNAYFITLTLDEDNKTDSPNTRDIQLYHKKLRQYFKNHYGYDRSLKYFLVSEYGYETERLHYHAVYFNLPYDKETSYIQISNELARVWGKGFCYVKNFDMRQVSYCLKYLHKDKELGNIKLNSKGLGEISDEYIRFMNSTSYMEEIKVRSANGWTINLPRYFRKKFFTDEQKEVFCDYFVRKNEKETADVVTRRRMRINFEKRNNDFMNNVKR